VNTKSRRLSLVAGAVVLSLTAAACGSSSSSSDSTATTAAAAETTAAAAAETTAAAAETTAAAAETTTAPAAGGEMVDASKITATLNASGATFPQAFYEEAIAEFQKSAPNVTINYGGGGSGKGRQDLADQLVDFAGSDGTAAAEDLPKFKGGDFLYIPTVLAPITVSYNLDVAGLQLSPTTLAGIFQRTITKWNDPAIAAENTGATLPDTDIVVVHRADGSGTTGNFTKFLDAAVGAGGSGVWTLKSGSTVEWPADTQAGQGNSGVAQIVKDTKGAIGYVDLSDAKASGLTFAKIENKAGKFVEPTLEATSAAAANVKVKDDLTFFTGWADGDTSYPIAAQTWVLVYKKQTDKDKALATKAFLQYVLTDGQDLAPSIDFAPLPKDLATKALAALDTLEIPS